MGDSFRYEMSVEDFYIYIFVHFTKHYRISGIGIKHVLDLWVYINAHPELNWEYILQELDKMGLHTFHENVMKTIDVWFKDAPESEATDLITWMVINSGQYGTEEMTMVNRALQKGEESATKIKTGSFLKTVFLPLPAMKDKYKVLKKVPILLPIMWVVRCFDVLFFRNGQLRRYVHRLNRINDNEVNKSKHALEVVGLTLDFQE